MVMALVTDLGKVRPVCLSRLYLNRSHDALERGDTLAAGCLLREAVIRYLTALCEYHDCTPVRKCDRKAMAMLRALRRKDQFTTDGFEWVKEAIAIGGRLTHCKPVRPSLVELSMSLLSSLMDCSSEIIFPNRNGGVL
jgi:hypothetical protein